MSQFSLKRLFVSMTLIAVGCGMGFWATQFEGQLAVSTGLVSIPVIGTGIGYLFHRPLGGMLLGSLLLYALLAVIYMLSKDLRHP